MNRTPTELEREMKIEADRATHYRNAWQEQSKLIAEMTAALEAFLLFGEYVDQHNGMTIDMLFPQRFAEARRIIDKARGDA